ncbi:MAG: ribonuclease III [Candidatus Levybacteria bacterium]|nr:ribonuclease III [Candidatus Levybacteria bacterium]
MAHWAISFDMKNLPKFKNNTLFTLAFTHRSYLNETKEKIASNERLEFLGDSILSFLVSEYLYKTYPTFDEGILTNLRSLLVNTKSLAGIAESLQFGSYLKLSKGEEDSGGRNNESILANSFEAFLGALYLDSGIESVHDFLASVLLPHATLLIEKNVLKDPKSLLQESVQAENLQAPTYKILHEEGPPHAKVFTVGVFVNGKKIGEGTGRSKHKAEEEAAKVALTSFGMV